MFVQLLDVNDTILKAGVVPDRLFLRQFDHEPKVLSLEYNGRTFVLEHMLGIHGLSFRESTTRFISDSDFTPI